MLIRSPHYKVYIKNRDDPLFTQERDLLTNMSPRSHFSLPFSLPGTRLCLYPSLISHPLCHCRLFPFTNLPHASVCAQQRTRTSFNYKKPSCLRASSLTLTIFKLVERIMPSIAKTSRKLVLLLYRASSHLNIAWSKTNGNIPYHNCVSFYKRICRVRPQHIIKLLRNFDSKAYCLARTTIAYPKTARGNPCQSTRLHLFDLSTSTEYSYHMYSTSPITISAHCRATFNGRAATSLLQPGNPLSYNKLVLHPVIEDRKFIKLLSLSFFLFQKDWMDENSLPWYTKGFNKPHYDVSQFQVFLALLQQSQIRGVVL